MITQNIRTSKYTTTIEIPAQKLHTRSKFIQISKSPCDVREEIITVPNECYESERQCKKFTLQTKVLVEELEKAYNEDVQALKDEISALKTKNQIDKLKMQNQFELQRRQLDLSRQKAEQSQSMLRDSRIEKESIVLKLQQEIKAKQDVINSQNKQIQSLENEIKELKKQLNDKNSLLTSKFRDIETEKDKRHNEERKSLLNEIDILIREKQAIRKELETEIQVIKSDSKLYLQQIELLKRQNNETKKDIEFQTNEINEYVKNLKLLEREKSIFQENNNNLHEKVEEQNGQIEKLLQEMRQQTIYIEQMQLEAGRISSSTGVPLIEGPRLVEEELNIARLKNEEYLNLLQLRETEITEKQTQYLLKLKEIDDERLNSKRISDQLALSKQEIVALNQQIESFKQSEQHLKTELAAKIVQYNNLLTRPPEHFDVRIEKTVDKKEYIAQLESKVNELEAIIDQLKEDNESYIEEIRKKVKENQDAKVREQSLIKGNEELKEYISAKEKSLGWAVERQIMKDVQISQDGSKEKPSGYKVYVKHSQSGSESGGSHIEVSGIQMTKEINFSMESKLGKILDKSRPNY